MNSSQFSILNRCCLPIYRGVAGVSGCVRCAKAGQWPHYEPDTFREVKKNPKFLIWLNYIVCVYAYSHSTHTFCTLFVASASTNIFISITLQVQTHKAADACKVAVIAFSWKCNSRKQHITTEKSLCTYPALKRKRQRICCIISGC